VGWFPTVRYIAYRMLRHEGKLISSMSDTVYTKTGNVNIEKNKQQQQRQSVRVSSAPQSFPIEAKKDKIGDFRCSNRLTMYAAFHRSFLSFIIGLLHMRILSELFTNIAKAQPGVLHRRERTVLYGVPFLFVIMLVNLPVTAAAQQATTPEEPEVDPFRIPQDDQPAAINDPALRIEEVAEGLKHPTAMTFLGSSDDIIVTEKDNGTVRRIVGGVVQPEPIVDVAVANDNDTNERGLLGMAVAKQNETTTYVFLYYTESGGGQDGDDADGVVPAGNRLYRYELVENVNGNATSAKLINPKLLLDLPARPGPRYQAGPLLVSQNQINTTNINGIASGSGGATTSNTTVYLMIGDLDHHTTEAENYEDGPPPDGTGGILAVDAEGNALPNPVLVGGETNGEEDEEDEEDEEESEQDDIGMLPYYFAYGLRNGFGMTFDPVTGYIWDTENGPDWFDEINLVLPGFNSGWAAVQGPASAPENEEADIEDDLEDFGGSGQYSDPEFAWQNTVGVTGIKFLNSTALGEQYLNDVFVGDINNGRIYHFDLNQDRTGLMLEGALEDGVADNVGELGPVIFGTGFRSITDIEVGPDGYLYILLYGPGKIYRIVPAAE
jgi:aldose sugar dehydrogenase